MINYHVMLWYRLPSGAPYQDEYPCVPALSGEDAIDHCAQHVKMVHGAFMDNLIDGQALSIIPKIELTSMQVHFDEEMK